jgi:enoyl-CoA hydratase/carnithine racemase
MGPPDLELPVLADAELRVEDRVATLTLARDDVRNELTGTALAAEIARVAMWADACDAVSVLVVTGQGRSFSAGGNVKDMAARSGAFAGDAYELQARYRRGIQRMTLAMDALGIPTIAAVNGAAIGAGFDLACMCDLRVAARGARLGETFVNLGIIPGDGGAWLLQRLIGYERAAELTFTGRIFDADEALGMGIVSAVVEPDGLAAHVAGLARQIADKPPRALRLTKQLLRAAQRTSLKDFLDLSAAYQAISHQNPEHHAAAAALAAQLGRPQ